MAFKMLVQLHFYKDWVGHWSLSFSFKIPVGCRRDEDFQVHLESPQPTIIWGLRIFMIHHRCSLNRGNHQLNEPIDHVYQCYRRTIYQLLITKITVIYCDCYFHIFSLFINHHQSISIWWSAIQQLAIILDAHRLLKHDLKYFKIIIELLNFIYKITDLIDVSSNSQLL